FCSRAFLSAPVAATKASASAPMGPAAAGSDFRDGVAGSDFGWVVPLLPFGVPSFRTAGLRIEDVPGSCTFFVNLLAKSSARLAGERNRRAKDVAASGVMA